MDISVFKESENLYTLKINSTRYRGSYFETLITINKKIPKNLREEAHRKLLFACDKKLPQSYYYHKTDNS